MVLTAAQRARLHASQFAIPNKARTKANRKKSGNYPIPDLAHAKAALSRVAEYGTPEERAVVRARVKAKFGIG